MMFLHPEKRSNLLKWKCLLHPICFSSIYRSNVVFNFNINIGGAVITDVQIKYSLTSNWIGLFNHYSNWPQKMHSSLYLQVASKNYPSGTSWKPIYIHVILGWVWITNSDHTVPAPLRTVSGPTIGLSPTGRHLSGPVLKADFFC